jgi:NAD(P)-dependent dehydrogenase (short-subunit alcohol dehydrogenase family)
MDLNLKDKSVIVTGGGSNIGRAISLAFAREGAHLTIAEIDAGQGGKAATDARAQGAASAEVVETDVTRWESVQSMVRAVQARRGSVDVLVNNVGWTQDRLFVEKTRDEWEKEVQLNLWGMINCTRAVLDGMIARKGGAIVSLGSDAGQAEPGAAPHRASRSSARAGGAGGAVRARADAAVAALLVDPAHLR